MLPVKCLCFLIVYLLCANTSARESLDAPVSLLPTQNSALAKKLNQLTITQLQAEMAAGKLSAQAITRFYLQEIKRKNPQLNAIVAVNPDALFLAKQLDKERAAGQVRGPLHGIPIAVKDNIETAGMPTTAGSLALKDNFTKRDAPLIRRLKDAGAIIIAKTNLSEWANFRSERSSSGWSAFGGQTRNPHDLSRSPCGSSSGSAVAVAANLAVAAIGTETNGSITCPASVNGIVGIKPTVGLVSRTYIVPISHTQDTAGPMTKSVADAALILEIMRGEDKDDEATKNAAQHMQVELVPSADKTSLKAKRVGVLLSPSLGHEAVVALFEKTKALVEKQGAVLVEDLYTEPYEGFWSDSYEVLLYEFKHDLNRYLASLPNSLNALTLEKLIAFNQQHADKEMPYFQQEIFEKSQAKGGLTDDEYQGALIDVATATRQEGIDKLMAENKLDVIITPTLGPAWTIDLLNGDHFTGSFSSYPAIAGYPHITLPMGKVAHMPAGLSVTGPAFSEKEIIAVASEIEALLSGN